MCLCNVRVQVVMMSELVQLDRGADDLGEMTIRVRICNDLQVPERMIESRSCSRPLFDAAVLVLGSDCALGVLRC